jgi:glutamate-1-semialdehyde aminotransferase
VTFIEPYPTYVDSAHGAELTTVNGEILIDFLNNYTQAIHGHAPEPVVDAVTSRSVAGNGLGSPTEDTIELAEQLAGRIPSVEHIRFANSGTEATMNAIRAAMAYTGREKVVKNEDELGHEFYYAMREEGIFIAPRGMGNISTVMGDAEIETFVDATNAAFSHVADI